MIGASLVILGAIITVVINTAFIPRYGYVASAWAHLICYSVMVVLSYVWSRKHYAIPYRIGRILLYMGLALVIYLINELFLQDEIKFQEPARLLLMSLFAATVYIRERHTFNAYKNK